MRGTGIRHPITADRARRDVRGGRGAADRALVLVVVTTLGAAGACARRGPVTTPPPSVVGLEEAELERLRGEPLSCAGRPSEWTVRASHEGATIEHPTSLRMDGRRVAAMLSRVDERLESYLPEPFPLSGVRVHLVSDPGSPVRPGMVATYSAQVDDGAVARVFVSSPSCVHPALRSGLGVPMDQAYMERTLVHELAGPALHQLTSIKSAGWRFYEGPAWFVQGMEEFVALSTENDDARPQHEAAWRAARDVDSRVSVRDGGIAVRDPYVDGRMLIAYLHSTIGRDGVLRLLRSEAPDFRSAFELATGGSSEEFVAGYRAWMADGPPSRDSSSGRPSAPADASR